jgi:hypothetical protein
MMAVKVTWNIKRKRSGEGVFTGSQLTHARMEWDWEAAQIKEKGFAGQRGRALGRYVHNVL